MADSPQILSKEEIFDLLLTSFLSRSEIVNDVSPGSVLNSLLLAFAEVGFKLSADQIALIDSLSIDRAQGEALRNLAVDKKVPIYSATSSTGFVNIKDLSFEKIETKVYPGLAAPVAGTNIVNVVDGSQFPASGAIYIGRGTSSVEGPLPYVSVAPFPSLANPSYYIITLAGTTVKFHNVGESVILAQGGDRAVGVGTVCQTPQGISAESIEFTTTVAATILDGEVEVKDVPVICNKEGIDGNVARGAISEVVGLPFDAECYNSLPISNARPDDDEETIRNRIKAYEQLKAKGTEEAVRNASIGVTSPDELKRVISASVKRTPEQEQFLVIDDGMGYEPITDGVGLEQLIDSAIGGEQQIQLENPMLQRATVVSLNSAPFDLNGGETLSIIIEGEDVPVHAFSNEDFKVSGSATAYEVVASINGSSQNLPYVARTVAGGTKVAISSRDRNEIQISTTSTANEALNFQTNKVYTARLYKNDQQTYQDGLEAALLTKTQDQWASVVSGDKFRYLVDNTTFVDITLLDDHFKVYSPTLTVNKDQPISIWANVLNDVLPGVVVTVVGTQLRFASKAGNSSSASLFIVNDDASYAIGESMFSGVENSAQGRESDYTLNLKTGQLEWAEPFQSGETATAGSKFTRAKFETSQITTPSISLGAAGNDAQIYAVVDGAAEFVPLDFNVSSGITTKTASAAAAWVATNSYFLGDYVTDSGDTYQALRDIPADALNPAPSVTPSEWALSSDFEVAISANGIGDVDSPFVNSRVGDWIVLWRDFSDVLANSWTSNIQGAWRVKRKIQNKALVIEVDAAVPQQSGLILVEATRFTSVRSTEPVQKVILPQSQVNSAQTLQDAFKSRMVGVNTSFINSRVRVESKTLDDNISEIFIAALSENSRNVLGLSIGKYSAVPSHNGFVDSDKEVSLGTPTFKILEVESSGNTDTTFENSLYKRADGTYNDIIQFIQPDSGIGSQQDSMTNLKSSMQVKDWEEVDGELEFTDLPLTLTDPNTDTQLIPENSKIQGDKFILRSGLNFDANDSITYVVDQNPEEMSFLSRVSRRVFIAPSPTPTTSTISVNDDETPTPLASLNTFNGFDFSNFKVWIQAKAEVQGLKFKYAKFGPLGSANGISFRYPQNGDSTISHLFENDLISSSVVLLGSGPERELATGDNWSQDSAFYTENLVLNGNSATIDVVHAPGTGLTPNFLGTDGPQVGDVVSILPGAGFRSQNKGQFKVTSVSANQFTMQGSAENFVEDQLSIDSIVYPDAASAGMSFGSGTALVTLEDFHNVVAGQRVGIYAASPADYIGTFLVTEIVDAYSFRIQITGIDGSDLSTVQRDISSTAGEMVKITVTAGSIGGIVAGDAVKISDVGVSGGSLNGIYTTSAGTGGTTAVIGFDPSLANPHLSYTVTLKERLHNYSTLTIGAHSFVAGDYIKVQSVGGSFDGYYKIKDVGATTISYNNIGADEAISASSGIVNNSYSQGDYLRRDIALPSATRTSNVVTATSATPHRLSNGDTVSISGFTPATFNGTFTISNVTATTFDYLATGPNGPTSTPATCIALFRTQNDTIQLPDTENVSVISAVWNILGYAELTVASHNISVGGTISVNSIDPVGYNGTRIVTAVTPTTIRFNLAADPGAYVSGGEIQVSSNDWVNIGNVPNIAVSAGRIDQNPTDPGSLARALQADANLRFFEVVSTRQDAADYINSAMSDTWEVVDVSSDSTIMESNEQYYSGSDYEDSGSIVIDTILGGYDRLITMPNAVTFEKGAKITFVAMGSSDLIDDINLQTFQIIDIDESNTILRIRSSRLADPSEAAETVSASWFVIQDTIGASRAETFVKSQTEGDPWDLILKTELPFEANDRAYLIATTAEQLARFSAKLAVSGLSNISEVSTARLDKTIQVKTNTFGSSGGVLVASGSGNTSHAAAISTGSFRGEMPGIEVLSDLAPSFPIGSYVDIYNTIAQRKQLGVTNLTDITIDINNPVPGVSKITTSQNELFQTQRPVVYDPGQTFKIEKHGNYTSLRQVGGVSANLSQTVKEGDWISIRQVDVASNAIMSAYRLDNISVITTTSAHGFSEGNEIIIDNMTSVSFNGTFVVREVLSSTQFTYFQQLVDESAVVGPGVTTRSFAVNGSNIGQFRVLKIFGDTVWFENPSSIDQRLPFVPDGTLSFYSYDSVMPGDVVRISGSILLASNVGAYTVSDRLRFFTDKEIYVNSNTLNNIGPVTLGAEFNNFMVEEREPIKLVKKIIGGGISSNSTASSFLGFDDDALIERINPIFGGVVTSLGKLGADQSVKLGLDGYRYFQGLLLEVYKTVYGDPSNPSKTGVRAAGTNITIDPPIIRRIRTALTIRVKTGIPVPELVDLVKSSASGYINSVGVGEPVSISALISEVQKVYGILSVEVDLGATFPRPDQGIIVVGKEEVPKVLDLDSDVLVAVVND